MSTILVSGIPIDVNKKSIKNMHLQVKPPNGMVVISAPDSMDDHAIEIYARTNLGWIKKQIMKYDQQPRNSKRQYVSGETLYVLGKQYYITFLPNERKNELKLCGDKALLCMRADSTVRQREKFIREQLRNILKAEMTRILPKWEKKTGISCNACKTKYMTTKWGACTTEKGVIWLNVQLAQKPIECIEYVILHELIHIKERTHNATFVSFMNEYMPNWRVIRKQLNDTKLDYYVQHKHMEK